MMSTTDNHSGLQEQAKALIDSCRTADWDEIEETGNKLADLGKTVGPYLVDSLASEDWAELAAIATALARLKLREAGPSLLRALNATYPERDEGDSGLARSVIATALAQIDHQQAIPSLLRVLPDALAHDVYLSWGLIDALGELRAIAAVPRLIDACEHCDVDVRKASTQALVAIGTPSVIPILEAFAASKGKYHLLKALDSIGDRRAISCYRRTVVEKEESVYLRALAAEALGRIRTPDAFEILAPILEDRFESSTVRAGAAPGLGLCRAPGVLGLLLDYLRRDDFELKVGAIDGLRHLGKPEAAKDLVEVLDSTGDPSVAHYAVKALREIGGPDARSALERTRRTAADRFGSLASVVETALLSPESSNAEFE